MDRRDAWTRDAFTQLNHPPGSPQNQQVDPRIRPAMKVPNPGVLQRRASILSRGGAFVVDFVLILLLTCMILAMPLSYIVERLSGSAEAVANGDIVTPENFGRSVFGIARMFVSMPSSMELLWFLSVLVTALVVYLYRVLSELFLGASLGKIAFAIRVRDVRQGRLDLFQVCIRNIWVIFPFIPLTGLVLWICAGVVIAVGAAIEPKNRSIFDLVTGTHVVRTSTLSGRGLNTRNAAVVALLTLVTTAVFVVEISILF